MPEPPVSADGVHASEAFGAGGMAWMFAGMTGAVVSQIGVFDGEASERLPALSTAFTV